MKTNLDSIYKASDIAVKDGVWFDISETTGFLCRPFKQSNPRIKAAMAKYFKPYARQIENETLSAEKLQEININLFLDVCLVEWKGVEIDGVEVKLDRETGLKLFKGLPELFDSLWKQATEFKNYRDDLGNS
jgi:hypothetical protein